jgi:2-octaprenyl-6-methoxyphenol hydroxylase
LDFEESNGRSRSDVKPGRRKTKDLAVTASTTKRFDIIICGGSFVGLALARALHAMAPGAYSIAIAEQHPMKGARCGADRRTVALTAAAKAMFEAIGVWPALARKAQPVLRIELTDSALNAPIRPSLIGLDSRETPSGEPTAYIVENADLLPALLASLEGAPGIAFFAPDRVTAFEAKQDEVEVRLTSSAVLSGQLLAAADGGTSPLREMAGIQTAVWPSSKTGIAVTAGIARPHQGIARQHFLPAGPFAILPMTGDRVSIVWTEDTAAAAQILAQDREAFMAGLSQRAGPELGALTLLSEPRAYPLTMTFAREFVRPRLALVGDAAHGLHWIAGQGLNHGLKDAAALAETLIDASRLGLDIGNLNVLKRYERWRRFDSATSAISAAALNTLFSNDHVGLRMLRSSGLRTADRLGWLKNFFMQEAAGLTGEIPKLLKGQPV